MIKSGRIIDNGVEKHLDFAFENNPVLIFKLENGEEINVALNWNDLGAIEISTRTKGRLLVMPDRSRLVITAVPKAKEG